MRRLLLFLITLSFSVSSLAKEYHVAKSGCDSNQGTVQMPLFTIQEAANRALGGDTIIVHEGIYREQIIPPRSGESAEKPIVYSAASGENVSIRGSEKIENWKHQEGNVWMVELDNTFFGDYNPYATNLSGDWLSYGHEHHVGEVYLNGESFYEKFSLDEVKNLPNTWYTEVDEKSTKIWANFAWANPNKNLAEINVRECVIFPEERGLKHIVIDGFEIKHAASNWAPPNRFQKGAIGTLFGYGWVIKNCRIRDVKCVAICIGNWDTEDYSKLTDSHYLPGSMSTIGHHLISNNNISRCGQAGIVGTWGGIGSIIDNNYISETNYKNQFGGAETAAIKLHFPIDVIIRDNYCKGVAGLKHRTKGIWMDYGVQNTRITGNIITDFQEEGFKLEAGHGPVIVDNNLFINSEITQWGDAGLFMHNLFYYCSFTFHNRNRKIVPYYVPHSTKQAGSGETLNYYDHYHNNIFIGTGLDGRSGNKTGTRINHNVYLEGAQKNQSQDSESIVDEVQTEFDFQKGSHPKTIRFNAGEKLFEKVYPLITSEFIGKLPVPKMAMENPDGTPLDITTDYFGISIDPKNVIPGPFQNINNERNVIEVWPKKKHLPPMMSFKSTRPKINQTGYLPDAPKEFSILSESAAAGQQFSVENENSEVVFTGALEASLVDDREVSGEEVFRGDFSGLKTAGRYRVKLGEKSSAWFDVQEDLFDQALFDMLRFFFLVKANSTVNDPVSGLAHGVSHATDEELDDGAGGVVNLSGGWYTGSDYSKIVPHTAFACAHLMNLYDANSSFFNQFDLSLPDHDETIPDLPELVRSGVEWLLKMQRADGSVFHEVVSSSFQMGAHGPDEDPSERSVCFTDRFSTIDAANVCAVAAQASRFFIETDPVFASKCHDAALLSWNWMKLNPGIGIEGSRFVDPLSWQEEMWAKAEIYMLTGDQTVLGSFYNDLKSKTVSALGLSTPELFGCLNLYHHPGTPSHIKTWIEQAVIGHAQRLKQVVDNSGYRCALDKYNWQEGNNSAIANSGNVFIYAFLISGNSDWLNHASFQVDYLLGRNSLDFSFVTGYGERRVRDPYHWIPGSYQFSPPGLLVNGAVDSRFIPDSLAANEVEATLKNAGFPVAKTYRDTIAFPLGNGITIANVSSLAYLTGFLSAYKRDVSNSFYDRPLAQTDGLALNFRNDELTCANCQGVSQVFLYNLIGQLLYSNTNVFFEKESNGIDLRNLIRKESVVVYKLVDENGAIGSGKVFFSNP